MSNYRSVRNKARQIELNWVGVVEVMPLVVFTSSCLNAFLFLVKGARGSAVVVEAILLDTWRTVLFCIAGVLTWWNARFTVVKCNALDLLLFDFFQLGGVTVEGGSVGRSISVKNNAKSYQRDYSTPTYLSFLTLVLFPHNSTFTLQRLITIKLLTIANFRPR